MASTPRRRWAWVLLLVIASLVIVGVYRKAVPQEGSTAYGQAAEALGDLPVKGRAPMTGYSLDQFGPAWSDNSDPALTHPWGHNGCGTRDDALARQPMSNSLRRVTRPLHGTDDTVEARSQHFSCGTDRPCCRARKRLGHRGSAAAHGPASGISERPPQSASRRRTGQPEQGGRGRGDMAAATQVISL